MTDADEVGRRRRALRRVGGGAGRVRGSRRRRASRPGSGGEARAGALPDAGPGRAAAALGRRHLLAAAGRRAAAGLGAQAAVQGQRRRGRVAHRGARPVRHRRPGHRLHAGPDRDPLRGRARPRGQGRAGHRTEQEHRVRRRQRRRPHPLARSPASPRSASRSPTSTRRSSASATCCARRSARNDHHPMLVGARQGRRGRLRRRQPREDAAPAGRRRHRLRQVAASSTR